MATTTMDVSGMSIEIDTSLSTTIWESSVPTTVVYPTSATPINQPMDVWKIVVIAVSATIAASLIVLLVCCLCRNRSPTIQRMRKNTNSHIERIKSTFQRQALPGNEASTANQAYVSEADNGHGVEPQGRRAQVDSYRLTDERPKPKTQETRDTTDTSRIEASGDTVPMTKPREGHTDAPPPKPHSNIRVPGYIGMGTAPKTGLSEKTSQVSISASSDKIDLTDRIVPKPPEGPIHITRNSPSPSPHLSNKPKHEYVNSLGAAKSNTIKDKTEEQENYQNADAWISQSTSNLPSAGSSAGQNKNNQPKVPKSLPSSHDSPSTSPAPKSPQYGNVKFSLKATVPVAAPEPEDVYENTQPDSGKVGYQNMQAIVDHERKGSSKEASAKGPGYMNITSMTANQRPPVKPK